MMTDQETEIARTLHCSSKSDLHNLVKIPKTFYNITNLGQGGIQNMGLQRIFQTLSGTSKLWEKMADFEFIAGKMIFDLESHDA